jgi:hypothetical protein
VIELYATLVDAEAECWEFFRRPFRDNAMVRATARERAKRLLTVGLPETIRRAWIEPVDPICVGILGGIREVASGYILMSDVWVDGAPLGGLHLPSRDELVGRLRFTGVDSWARREQLPLIGEDVPVATSPEFRLVEPDFQSGPPASSDALAWIGGAIRHFRRNVLPVFTDTSARASFYAARDEWASFAAHYLAGARYFRERSGARRDMRLVAAATLAEILCQALFLMTQETSATALAALTLPDEAYIDRWSQEVAGLREWLEGGV